MPVEEESQFKTLASENEFSLRVMDDTIMLTCNQKQSKLPALVFLETFINWFPRVQSVNLSFCWSGN